PGAEPPAARRWPGGRRPRPGDEAPPGWRPARGRREDLSGRLRGCRARHPRALLLLPDRRPRLDLIDYLPSPGKGGVTVGRRGGHDHGRLRQRDCPHPVLGRGGTEPVALHRPLEDLSDLSLGHLDIRLVVELLHLARYAEEG